jgi:aminoglycoside phosphotransferase (APT) family kinase protein
MPAMRLPAGDPIARGNTSDIWPWSEGTVVKILRPGIPAHWAAVEADILARVHAAGLPAPATDGVVEVEGRTGIVLERIHGVSMWERMKARPDHAVEFVDIMVDLQLELHRSEVAGLPDLARRLGSKIDEAVQLSAADRRRVQSMLSSLPAGSALCHGDFHPANIVLTAGGPVILDWFDAAAGHPTSDLVRSSLLLRAPARNTWLTGASQELLERVHRAYIARLARRGSIGAATFAPWEAVVAVARLSEPVPVDELLAVWDRWRADGEAAVAAMIADCLEQPIDAADPAM